MLSYGIIPLLVVLYLVIRLWVLNGPKTPLIALGISVLAYFVFPYLPLPPVAFPIFMCALGIYLWFIDKHRNSSFT
jgi:hypothetical protein